MLALLLYGRVATGQTAVCGNGVTEPGEQCDVADTLSGVDECDGCHTDCTVTAECGLGPCTDNIDNDGNGLIDEKDPKCSSLHPFSSFAASANSARSASVRLGVGSRIAESTLAAGSELCGRLIDMRSMATVAGSVVAVSRGKFKHRQSSGIGGKFVTTDGVTPSIPWAAALVGPGLGVCSTSANACLSPLDCTGRGEECVGRTKLNAANPSVDLLGTGVGSNELARCNRVLTDIAENTSLLALTSPSLGALRIGRGNRALTLNVGSGGTILTFESLILGAGGVLTINAPRHAALVIRVDGRFAALSRSRVELTGGIEPENVLWMITGNRGVVLLGRRSMFQGFLWAPQRSVTVDSNSQVRGSLVGRQVRIGRNTQIEHHPFLSLLPSAVDLSVTTSPDPVIASGPMTYDVAVTNSGPGVAVVANLRLELDSQTVFAGALPSQGLCMHDGSASGGIVTCYLGDLADPSVSPANQATIAIHVTVDAAATQLNATATLNHTIAISGEQIVPVTTAVVP